MRAMTFAWEGASALSTPIWMPSEERFAKPHRQYDAIVNERCESGLSLAMIAFRSAGCHGSVSGLTLRAGHADMAREMGGGEERADAPV